MADKLEHYKRINSILNDALVDVDDKQLRARIRNAVMEIYMPNELIWTKAAPTAPAAGRDLYWLRLTVNRDDVVIKRVMLAWVYVNYYSHPNNLVFDASGDSGSMSELISEEEFMGMV